MWSSVPMQPQFLIWELGSSFPQGGAHCHTPHWSLGLWWNLPQPHRSLTQFRPCQSHQRCFGSDFTIPWAPGVPGTALTSLVGTFIITPVGFGITKSQLGFISQKLFCLLKADVERGWPARGQGLNPLLTYICVYSFHNAGFGTEFDCVCSSPKPTLVIFSHSSPAHVIWGFSNCKLRAPKLGFPGR